MKLCEDFVPTNVEPATKILPQQRPLQQLHQLVLTDTTFGASSTFGDAAGAQEFGEIVKPLVASARAKLIKLDGYQLLINISKNEFIYPFQI